MHRPNKKIILLHGPPGLGKTTVAHVAARQAGYDVLEINASDERAGQAVLDKIKGATESHRVGKRPVCIIADEVEGGAESVSVLRICNISHAKMCALLGICPNSVRYHQL